MPNNSNLPEHIKLRYGVRRRRVIPVLVGILIAGVVSGSLAYAAFRQQNPSVSAQLLTFEIVSPTQVNVTWELARGPELTTYCVVRAQDISRTDVGYATVTVAGGSDYEQIKEIYRPSHADYTFDAKYGIRDYRGGGRSSARETAARVVAGAIAKLLLKHYHINVTAYVSEIGKIKCSTEYSLLNLADTEKSLVRCPDKTVSDAMIKSIEKAKKEGDSLGGIIKCIVSGMPAGLGEPVFDKLHADIGKAVLSINAVKGFEYGSGFAGTKMKGSEHNDTFTNQNGKVVTTTNYSGGIQGGISNGMDFYCNVAFKPTATIAHLQQSVDKKGNQVEVAVKGRHDPCVVPRAVPIVEAMIALTIADHLLRNKTTRL